MAWGARTLAGADGQDPEWKALSADPQYRDNVSAVSDIILRPTAYSQI